MLYFGQEVGEQGLLDSGFGDPSRTTIFDYAQVPAHARWVNLGRYDGGQLSRAELDLRRFYQRLLQFIAQQPAGGMQFIDLHRLNLTTSGYSEQQFSFARVNKQAQWLVLANFANQPVQLSLQLPAALTDALPDKTRPLWQDWFSGQVFRQSDDNQLPVQLPAHGVLLLRVQSQAP